MKIADVLEKAADLIEPEGAWAQGMFGLWSKAGCLCAVGAVCRALDTTNIAYAEDWLDQHASSLLGFSADGLVHWNDEYGRTQPEVVAKLREAAAKAREQGL